MSNAKELNKLKIYRGSVFAGTLNRTQQGCQLKLSDDFLNNDKYSGLTYQIKKPKFAVQYNGVNLPPFFAGLLPEGLRLKALVKELKTSEDDLFSLLAVIGERSVGDIYTLSEQKKNLTQDLPKLKDIDFYELFSDHLQSGFMNANNEGFAGVQEKISASMISFPIRLAKKNKFYILKLNPTDKPNLVYNEFQSLNLAKKCGLTVNNSKIVYDKNNNPGLLVERFDRVFNKKENKVIKVHQEDACQFLGRYPADKYRLSFEDICEGIKEHSTAPSIEILKAIQLYLFSYLIGNGDLHAKNISLQTSETNGRIQLTPTYDIICTYIYADKRMALKVRGRDTNIKRKYIIQLAQQFGINERSINQTIDKLLVKFNKNYSLLTETEGLSQKNKNQINEMVKNRTLDLSA